MYDNIPRQLKTQKFCTHKNKVPNAHTDNPDTFTTFDDALNQIERDPSLGLGIGLFDNLCGIDLDGCINPDGTIHTQADIIIKFFPEAYVERSLSGTGIHLLFFCDEQVPHDNYYNKLNEVHMKNNNLTFKGLEIYQGQLDNRYFTMSGDVIYYPTSFSIVESNRILTLFEAFCKKPVTPVSTIPASNNFKEDAAWYKWARTRTTDKAKELTELLHSFPPGKGSNESELDYKILSALSFWCNKNPKVIRKAFEASPYFNNKDTAHQTKWTRYNYYYARLTINKAIRYTQNTAKEFFKDSYYYDEEFDCIIRKEEE